MSIEITVPVLPESVADALLLEWQKPVGAQVKRDEILVELETDKIVLEVVAPQDGVLAEINYEKGATVKAGDILAKLESGSEAAESGAGNDASAETNTTEKPRVESHAMERPAVADQASSEAHDAGGSVVLPQGISSEAEPLTSPAVRRLVEEHGLNPADIPTSGDDGRITKADIIEFIAKQVAPGESEQFSEPAPTPSPVGLATESPAAQPIQPPSLQPQQPPQPQPPQSQPQSSQQEQEPHRQQTREPLSRLRQTIAKRLVLVQQTAALLTTFNEVNMQPVMDLRAKHRDQFEKDHGVRLGFMSFFVKASVEALQKFPLVNAYIDGNDIVQHNYCDIGIAVSSPRGLLVPVLRNCERSNFVDIESQIKELGERARDAKISIDDLSGGTFTITNGGVFGSMLSTPIVNPPQSAILGMHNIQPRPIAENDQVVIRPMMYLALSYDHRIIDGQQAVEFLVTIKETLEDPEKIWSQG